MKELKISNKILWAPLYVNGEINCPQCNSVMLVNPITSLPSIAYCSKCHQYFYDASEKR